MTYVVTTNVELRRNFVAPALPQPPATYSQADFDKFNNVLRLYFNQIDAFLGRFMTSTSSEIPISFPPTALDAFGRQRVSQPYTLFDSQNRYATDNQFDTSTSGTGSLTFNTNRVRGAANLP